MSCSPLAATGNLPVEQGFGHPVHQCVKQGRQRHSGREQQKNVIRSDPPCNAAGKQTARSGPHHTTGSNKGVKPLGLLGSEQVAGIPIQDRQVAAARF